MEKVLSVHSVNDYARYVGAPVLHPLVRVKTGGSASQYIRHFLMQKARSMLHEGRSVSEVSDALGFEYPQNLTRMFKKEFGVAPSKIRKNGF